MDVRFRYHGGVGGNVNPPGFVAEIHEDGFTVTVPVGYQVNVNPLHPPIVQIQNNDGQVGQGQVQGQEQVQANPVLTAQIEAASLQQRLFQHEVLYLLQNDTIELEAEMEKNVVNGLLMYPFEFRRRSDGHRYPRGGHTYLDLQLIGEVGVCYRHSVLPDLPGGVVTVRRYYLDSANPGKLLVHYIRGQDHVEDNMPQIPVQHPPA